MILKNQGKGINRPAVDPFSLIVPYISAKESFSRRHDVFRR